MTKPILFRRLDCLRCFVRFFLGFLHSALLAGTNYYHERNQHPLGSYPITDTVVGVNRGEDESRPAQGLLLL